MKTILSALLFAQLASMALGACQTTTGVQCEFPFTYREMSFTKCTKADYGKYWCATSLNDDGSYKTYGDCQDTCEKDVHDPETECLTKGGFRCIFPFTYNSTIHNKCTDVANNGMPWCAINKYPGSEAAFHFEACNMDSNCAK